MTSGSTNSADAPPVRPRSFQILLGRLAATKTQTQDLFLTSFAGGIVALMSWPIVPPELLWNIESSWRLGLQMAWASGSAYGTDITFTYGPLGFLLEPEPFVGTSSIAGFAIVGLIHLALSIGLVWLARSAFPIWGAVPAAYLGMRALEWLDAPERILGLVFLGCVWLLLSERRRSIDIIAVGLLGTVSAFALVGKTSVGLAVLVLVCVTALAITRPRRYALLIAVGAIALSFGAFWLVAGQSFEDIWPFALGAIEIVRGYSSAMGVDEDPTVHWQVLAYLICAIVVLVSAWQATRAMVHGGRVTIMIVCLVFLFATWKIGFVRWHSVWAILLTGVASFAFLRSHPARARAALGLLVILVTFLGVSQVEPTRLVDPSDSLAGVARDARLVTSAAARREEVMANRAGLKSVYALDDETRRLLRQGRTHIDPVETGVAFAYRLPWSPEPIFQSYSAYTLELDRRNADFLKSRKAPEHILRQPNLAIDGRNPWFDAPGAMVEMLCRYTSTYATPGWQVLTRGPSHCGDAELIGQVAGKAGVPVVVPTDPRPDRLVYVSVEGVGTSVWDQIESILIRGEEWFLTTDGTHRWRLVPGTAGSSLIMSVPTAFDYPPPYGFGAATTSIMVSAGLDGDESSADLTFRFYSLPILQRQGSSSVSPTPAPAP